MQLRSGIAAAAAPIWPLAWELLYAVGVTLKRTKKEKKYPSGEKFTTSTPIQKLERWYILMPDKIDFKIKIVYNFFFLGSHQRHTEVPRLGVEYELQLLAYTTATAMENPSHICDPHHSPWQWQILNPLSEARDQTHDLMDTSQVRFCWATTGTPKLVYRDKGYVIMIKGSILPEDIANKHVCT